MNYWVNLGVTIPYISETVLNEVFRLTDTHPDDLKSKSRKMETVIVRQAYCYAARELIGATTHEIGEVINRDHATVIHSCRVIKDAMETSDRHVMEVMEKIKSFWK